MLKSSNWIKEQAKKNHIINPFISHSERKGVISYGLGPYGYDIRLHKTYKKLKQNINKIDPHQMREEFFETLSNDKIIIEPGTFILGRSFEFLKIPKKVMGIVFGKSTYARSGILINVTPLEPEWSGFITISISNVSGKPTILHSMQGIAQVLFFESDEHPLFSYKDLKGKYNEQKDIIPAKIQ